MHNTFLSARLAPAEQLLTATFSNEKVTSYGVQSNQSHFRMHEDRPQPCWNDVRHGCGGGRHVEWSVLHDGLQRHWVRRWQH